jgi:diphthamide biosynthesis protein 2
MSDGMSTPAAHAFVHPELDIQPEAGPSSNGDAVSDLTVEAAFEVEDTIRRIVEGGYKTVCYISRLSPVHGRYSAGDPDS